MANSGTLRPVPADCSACGAVCCTYLNIVVENPTTPELVEDLLWHIFHGATEVYLDTDGDWSVVFHNRCLHLTQGNLCAIYSRRPGVCRRFSAGKCHGGTFETSVKRHFKDGGDLIAYIREKRPALFRRLRPQIRRLGGGNGL